MDPTHTILNGQPVPRDVVELATSDDGVNTAIVAFLAPDYRRVSEADTQIRAPLARAVHEADTQIEAPSGG